MLPLRLGRYVAALLLVGCQLVVWTRAQEISSETELKAAFVYQFAKFVEWPTEALEKRPALEYCVWSPNPFGGVLRELVAGESVAGRPLVVRDLTPSSPLTTCHVLFVQGPNVRGVLQRAQGHPILTVGDSPAFLEEGGIIQLVRAGNHVRFNISLPAAERARLRLSSRLLELAGNMRRGGA